MAADSEKDLSKEAMELLEKRLEQNLQPSEQQRLREYVWTRKKQIQREKARKAKAKSQELKRSIEAVLIMVKEGTESPIEERMALALSTRSICAGMVKTQYNVGPYRLDIAFPHIKLGVECDGRAYHTSPAQIARDQKRDAYLNTLGWVILRFTGSRIHRDLYGCVDDVTREYERLSDTDAWEAP